NLVASILIKGALARRAKRRAISVLLTPVGPIIKMFFGDTSARSSSLSCMRRHRLRNAKATARVALSWPMIWRLGPLTISGGVRTDIVLTKRILRKTGDGYGKHKYQQQWLSFLAQCLWR